MIPGNLIFDLALVLILVFGLSSGWKRGLVGMVLKGGATVLSALITFGFYRTLGAFVKDRFLYSSVHTAIDGAIRDLVGPFPTADELVASVPENLRRAAGLFDVDLYGMASSAVEDGGNAIESFTAGAAGAISGFLGSAIAFITLFIASYILLRFFSKPLSKIVMKLPLIGTLNRVLGLVLALVIALFISWVLVQLVALLDSAAGFDFIEIEASWIARIYHHVLPLSDLIGGH